MTQTSKLCDIILTVKFRPNFFLWCGIAMASKVQLHRKTHVLMGMAI